jgi:hypothetical protein
MLWWSCPSIMFDFAGFASWREPSISESRLKAESCANKFCSGAKFLAKNRSTQAPQLWLCEKCGRQFANRNQSHFCGRHSMEKHFEGKSREVRQLFDAWVRLLRRFGPVRVLPEKTRIAFQVRMSFAAVSVRRTYLVGHFVLARRFEHRRFTSIDTISPRNHVHHFRLSKLSELDKTFSAWAREAYAVGQQKHLQSGRTPIQKTSRGSI